MTAFTETEKEMVAVERTSEYIGVQSENFYHYRHKEHRFKRLDSNWPSSGRIEFVHVTLRYRDGPNLALKNLSFNVDGGERIGIVGRTGAGKTSILQALFRMERLWKGGIRIDGVDCEHVSLARLRHRLAIIPQVRCSFQFAYFHHTRCWFVGPCDVQRHRAQQPRPVQRVQRRAGACGVKHALAFM